MKHRNEKVFRNASLNTIAFGIIIAMQQLLVFPVLSRTVDVSTFADAILFITAATVVVNVIGGEVSNVALIRGGEYNKGKLSWDAPRIALFGGFAIIGALFVVTFLGYLGARQAFELGLIAGLGIIRTVGLAPDKYVGRFETAVHVSMAYSLGAITGLIMIGGGGSALIPFVFAEAFAVLCWVFVRNSKNTTRMTFKKTSLYSETKATFIDLAIIALIMNSVSYMDRVLIIPILGSAALAVYYASSALSKSLSLLSNPAANAILARLGSTSEDERGRLSTLSLKIAAPVFVVAAGASFVVAYVGVKYLYPHFFEEAQGILLPVAVASSLGVVSDVFRPLALRFVSSRVLLIYYGTYALVYLALILILGTSGGLLGFAWAVVAAKAVLVLMLIVQAYKLKEAK